MKKLVLISIPLIFALSACNIINSDEPIPAYLHIEPFQLNTSGMQGSDSENISAVWITTREGFLGAYPLPATVPVLEEGAVSIIFDPGIKENGIAALPNIYPFYERYQEVIELVPGQIDTVRPVISYDSRAVFILNENFENSLHVFRAELDGNEETSISTNEDFVFEGNRSGRAILNEDNPQLEVGSDRFVDFPPGGSQVYLELNYKNSIDFFVGVTGYDDSGIPTSAGENFLRAREDWNKVYINLTEQIDFLDGTTDITSFQVVFVASLPFVDGGFQGDGELLFDNIKLVSF